MSKSTFERPLTLNLVFLLCLCGSILFALVGQVRAHHQDQAASAERSALHSSHTSAAG